GLRTPMAEVRLAGQQDVGHSQEIVQRDAECRGSQKFGADIGIETDLAATFLDDPDGPSDRLDHPIDSKRRAHDVKIATVLEYALIDEPLVDQSGRTVADIEDVAPSAAVLVSNERGTRGQ